MDAPNEQPALIITLSGDPGSLAPTPRVFDAWRREDESRASAHHIIGPHPMVNAADSEYVQIALGANGSPAVAWGELRRLTQQLFERLRAGQVTPRGYSLLYQAFVTADAIPAAVAALLEHALPLGDDQPRASPLAMDARATGTLALVRARLDADSEDLSNVYLAVLASGTAQPDWGNRAVLGEGSEFLLPDMIAHKGYDQIRQYRGDGLATRYEADLERLGQSVNALLREAEKGSTDPGRTKNTEDVYRGVLRARTAFELLQLSLEQQVANLEKPSAGSPALAFHLSSFRTAVTELSMFVRKGQIAHESALLAVETARALVEERAERRQEVLQNALGGLGAALAVPQIVTLDVAKEIATSCGLRDEMLTKVLIQIALVVAFAVLFVGLLHRFRAKRDT